MLENGKIGVGQFTVLVTLFTIGTTILIIPAGLAAEAKQDAWITAILGVGVGLLLVLFYNAVSSLFPQMTIVQYSEILLGKWIGKMVSLLFVFFSFIGATTLLFIVGNFMTTQIMPATPIQALNIIFALIVVMGVRLGLEVIARSAEILFPWFVLLFIVLILFISPQLEFQNLLPVLETGIKPILRATLSFASTASLPFIVFFMIFPVHVNKPKAARKGFLIGTLIGGTFMILIVILCILVLGADTTARHMYPSYTLVKKINVGDLIQRIEAIMAGMWFITIYFKLTLYFYAAVLGLAQILELKDYRPLTLPLGMILVVFSLVVYPNVPYMNTWDEKIWPPFALTMGLILPLVLFVVGNFKKHIQNR